MKNLQTLFKRIIDKTEFVKFVAHEFNLSYAGTRANWFSSWQIPEQHQERVQHLMINWIKAEMKKTSKLLNK